MCDDDHFFFCRRRIPRKLLPLPLLLLYAKRVVDAVSLLFWSFFTKAP